MTAAIDQLDPPIRGLILDMDGVLWRDSQPIGDLKTLFRQMRERGLRVLLATNNATRSTRFYLDKLAGFGVHLEDWQVVTSAEATAEYLRRLFPNGGPLYVVGETGLKEALAARGFTQAEEGVLAVVAGLDRDLTYEKLKRATLLVNSGVRFIGTNPDRTLPTPEGDIPGAGTILAALEASTGQKPLVIGKPAPAMFEVALARLETSPGETLVIGDRLETDIAGGQAVGCRTALVLTGVSSRSQGLSWSPPPDLILDAISDLFHPPHKSL